MSISYRNRLIAAAIAVLTMVLVGAWVKQQLDAANIAPDFAKIAFVGSEQCLDCHRDRHTSWQRTFHRTMTQPASKDSVQGHFDGQPLHYGGVEVRPKHEGDRWWFEYRNPASGELISELPVVRTVGSNRYQQYLTQQPLGDGTYYRLHYLWHNQDQQWVRVNNAFLHGDDLPFDQMVSVWDHNCIFCHNTGPEPHIQNYAELQARAARGEPVDAANDATYASRVAELGIGCESCHGPGQAHIEANASIGRRWLLQLTDHADASIVNPADLSAERSTQICGQCHAQRLPKSTELLQHWLNDGPTYRAGMNLNDHVEPVWQFTTSPARDNPDLYKDRFWGDGSPRLSAYEYQGLLQSRCYQEADLSCIDCHSMHAGDPAGMISERNRGNAPCLGCHQDLRETTAQEQHSRHSAEGPGGSCYACHMPVATYGVMTTHRSHLIAKPDPQVSAQAGKPNACSNCHQDRSLRWVAEQLRDGWGWQGQVDQRADGADPELADGYAQMLAGDAVQRAIAAVEAGKLQGLPATRRASMIPALLGLLDDRYPSSRRFASHSLIRLSVALREAGLDNRIDAALANYDWQATQTQRSSARDAVQAAWHEIRSQLPIQSADLPLTEDLSPEPTQWQALQELGNRRDREVSIGE